MFVLLRRVHPYFIIIGTFVTAVLIGTLFLVLPISASNGKSIGFIDASTDIVLLNGIF